MIAVVDYRMGNLKSVERGLRAVGADARIVSDAREIAAADAIVLPGVGAFGDAARSMRDLGQMEAIRHAVHEGKPFLGICLGLHLLFTDGVEGADEGGTVRGLGLLEGTVERMPGVDAQGKAFKIPHVGWNSIEMPLGAGASERAGVKGAWDSPEGRPGLFAGIGEGEFFYFTHSYMAPSTPYTIAETEHSVRFTSAVALSDRVFGVQFHPEKSSDAGARVLANFVTMAKAIS